ncbi:MAG: hypothetical protein KF734_03145 [Saprospiraceae bacterium]|nr:hypothetical protein [Saprospiraceae bacterium]
MQHIGMSASRWSAVTVCYAWLICLATLIAPPTLYAQKLEAGFDKLEYLDMLRIAARVADTPWTSESVKLPEPRFYKLVYRSPTVGLENKWDLWRSRDGRAVVSVRGTTSKPVSWLANFYAAMVPANGSIQISNAYTFHYKLAENPRAAVHVGWLVALACLQGDIVEKIKSIYDEGVRDIVLTGHSQGGAITYLLTSHLNYLQKEGKLPKDIRFKTYCGAGPKPGNLYYAYDYENLTRDGWAFNVVNALDWVPEVPFSVQTVNDYNRINPFVNARAVIKKQGFPKNMVLKGAYKRMTKPSLKAQRRYQKYLGKMLSKEVQKTFPEFKAPKYYDSNHYVRTGNMIVLIPDAAYLAQYPDNDPAQLFIHHLPGPYHFLVEKW